jgi:hypothetical protein
VSVIAEMLPPFAAACTNFDPEADEGQGGSSAADPLRK